FISENFANFMEGGDESVNYAALDDSAISPDIIDDSIRTMGYFIYPSQLFGNIAANANSNTRLASDLNDALSAIEASAIGYPSQAHMSGIFSDFNTESRKLGELPEVRGARLANVMNG